MPRLDHIEMDGVNYEFVDQNAREQISSLASREYGDEQRLTEAISTEVTRATNAERALQTSKVDIEQGKGLSSNDFTDEYIEKIENPDAFSVGHNGAVPAPTTEDAEKYLDGSGNWSIPHDTTYEDATEYQSGLMSAADKLYLEQLHGATFEESAAKHVTFNGNVIHEVYDSGKTKTTTLHSNYITQFITGWTEGGSVQVPIDVTIRFNNDGSIDKTSALHFGFVPIPDPEDPIPIPFGEGDES